MSPPYNIIYADFPWPYNPRNNPHGTLFGGGAPGNYATMDFREIAQFPLEKIAAKNCALFLWATWPLSIEPVLSYLLEGWGFKYRTLGFIWIKLNKKQMKVILQEKYREMTPDQLFGLFNAMVFKGPGYYTMANSEPCLLAVRGRMEPVDKGVGQVILYPRVFKGSKHSSKPPIVRDRIVQLFGDLPRVELFARAVVPGWDGWGKEYPK